MQRVDLSVDEILAAYGEVSALYPFLPPLSLWRAWELAAYRRLGSLDEPVLDIGCGDGKYFRLVWPTVGKVVGVEQDPVVAKLARDSGVYQTILELPAQHLSVGAGEFASAFANCSLEHMDDVDRVLRGIAHAVAPGGRFLLSVVTEKFLEWAPLPMLAERLAGRPLARCLADQYAAYHHLTNPWSVEKWVSALESAGFEVEHHIPLLPEMSSRLFLFMDALWHVPREGGAVGEEIRASLGRFPQFDGGFGLVMAGVLMMEREPHIGSGAVFAARRVR